MGEPQNWKSGERGAEPKKFPVVFFSQRGTGRTGETNVYTFLIKMRGKPNKYES